MKRAITIVPGNAKSKRNDSDMHQQHQNNKAATYGNDGKRAKTTKNGCGVLMSGIAQAKAVHSLPW